MILLSLLPEFGEGPGWGGPFDLRTSLEGRPSNGLFEGSAPRNVRTVLPSTQRRVSFEETPVSSSPCGERLPVTLP